ncbi:hypothetical protein FGO68_gene17257 [Halteria grandinella]|uniref:Uncharacterized protein n=1 Tax=Halteria grandinella TaxID=5974 RepID=A0A8J8SXN5_HALGN|nr:hypothetical protein FGO68_gene17257 [Halteria grandinella]
MNFFNQISFLHFLLQMIDQERRKFYGFLYIKAIEFDSCYNNGCYKCTIELDNFNKFKKNLFNLLCQHNILFYKFLLKYLKQKLIETNKVKGEDYFDGVNSAQTNIEISNFDYTNIITLIIKVIKQISINIFQWMNG